MSLAREHPGPTGGAARGVEHALARQRQKYEDEVDRLLTATMELIRVRDDADPTVNEILARAGLSTTAFYRHFPTKDDLFVALLERGHELTAAHVARRLAAVTEPRARIETWVRALFDLVRTPTALAQNRPLLLAHPRLLQRFPAEIDAGFAALAVPMEQAILDARRRAGDPSGHAAIDARLALHQIFGILVDAAAVRTPPARRTIDAVVSYTLRAVLGAEVAPAPVAAGRRPARAR